MDAAFLPAVGTAGVRRTCARFASCALLVLVPLAAHGHGLHGEDVHAGAAWDVALALLLAVALALYARGVLRLWRAAGTGRGVRRGDAVRFALGWAVLAAALLSPIDRVADRSFALHMLQHELLMVVAAPLLVLGRPLEAWAWGLSARTRGTMARFARARLVRAGWVAITGMTTAWCLHATALWLWHVPVLFDAAVTHVPLHVLQHACFLGSALLFWTSVLRGRVGAGAMLALFTTMLHTAALGALLTFASAPWYLDPGQPVLLGLTAIEDQQLGGLLMWVPGGVAYVLAALVIVAGWLAPVQREALRWQSAKVVPTPRLEHSSELPS